MQPTEHWSDTPCQEWTGARLPKGYGRVGRRGKVRLTHREAWEETNGPIPEGMCVLHHCDNPPCRNVAHLFLGTVADNNADMIAKGRARFSSPGERNGRAVLTTEDVAVIRAALERGESQWSISRRFPVSRSQVQRIGAGRAWATS